MHRLDLLRQRRPRGHLGGLVPADLPRADAGDGAGLDGGAQDDPHRQDLPHHLDRRLHRQPLWQEPLARRAGDADHRGRHRALHRAAAEGHLGRLRAADHATGRTGGGRRRLVARQHALRRAGAGRLHHRVRRAAPGQRRTARRHGRGDRLRVGGQAGGVSGRRPVRGLRPLRRARRAVCPRGGGARAGAAAAPRAGRWLRLRAVVRAGGAVDAVGDLPAAAVPGDGGRERRRAPSEARVLGVSAVPAADQPVRAADRVRRAADLRRGAHGPGRLRAFAAAGPRPAGARAGGLHRRSLGGHRHGDRGNHRRLHDGLQRPADALAAAHAQLRRARGGRLDANTAGDTARRDLRRDAARLPVLPPRRRGLCAGQHRPHQLCGGGAVRAGHARRPLLEGRHPARCAGRAVRRLRAVGLHPAAAVLRQVGVAARGLAERGPLGHRIAQARATARAGRARQPHAFAVLEPAGQCRRLRGGVAGASAVGAGGQPGLALCRHLRALRGARAGVLARARARARPAAAGWPLSRCRAGAAVDRRPLARQRRTPRAPSRASRTHGWCSSSRRSSPVRSAAPRRA